MAFGNPLIQALRQVSAPYPLLGLRNIRVETDEKETDLVFLEAFLHSLEQYLGEKTGPTALSLKEEGKDSLADGVTWKRFRITGVFPILAETCVMVDKLQEEIDNLGDLGIGFRVPGELHVERILVLEVVESGGVLPAFLKEAIDELLSQGSASGGAAVNLLRLEASALVSGKVDLRPVVLGNFDAEHRAADLRSAQDQSKAANAFWQTYWATGALRSQRGVTFPVAFLPIERHHPREFEEPFRERFVTLRRRLFGRTALVGYALESLTREKALWIDTQTGRYHIHPDYNPQSASWPCSAVDMVIALEELERTGWVDRYTGDNRTRFATTPQIGLDEQGEPRAWPYGNGRGLKIKAKGPAEDFLAGRRLPAGDGADQRFIRIHRVVPYAGVATLGQIFRETERLQACGKLPPFGGELVAGTNSTFFLNFPEEYGSVHGAMNDPVSTLVEDGKTRHLKTLRRATFALTTDGRPVITTRMGNHLNSEVLLFEGESVAVTGMRGARKGPGGNKVGPLFFGAVVVGDSIVETFEESASEVPVHGWIAGDSEAFGGRMEPAGAVRASLRLPGELQETPLRHALSVGPLLVEAGEVVSFGNTGEDFVPYVGPSASADETQDLARSEMAPSQMAATQVGVPPTRFPHDANKTRAPRTALGITEQGDVVLVVVDGRADLRHSVGVTLDELAYLMKGLGCRDAMNLDGGGSSVMTLADPEAPQWKLKDNLTDGVVNLPSDLGGSERLLPVPLVVVALKQSL